MSAQATVLAEGVVEIRCPRHDVFAYVTNLENFPAWFPGVLAMRSDNALAHAQVGKRYRETLRMPFGRKGSIDIEVKEVQAQSHFMTEGAGLLLPSMRVDLDVLPDGSTRVDWRMVSRSQRWWVRWFVVPLARRVMGRRAVVGLGRLRANLEGVAPGPQT